MTALESLIGAIGKASASRSASLLIAIDGRGGVGKSTLAAEVGRRLKATLIDGDDFYAGGNAALWDAMSAEEKAAHCIDWRRQRGVLEGLSRGERVSWRPYDWEADDGRLSETLSVADPAPVVILEGVYSARPELADLVGLRIFLNALPAARREHLLIREGESFRGDWEERWSEAEEFYFAEVMPPEAFDLIIDSF